MCALIQKVENEDLERRQQLAMQLKGVVGDRAESKTEPQSRTDKVLAKARRHAEAGRWQEAIDLLNGLGTSSAAAINDKAVCLMRMGRAGEAVNLLRNLVLKPGSTWMRKDLPVSYKVNFATSLALAGLVSGSTEIIGEIADATNPAVARLNASLAKWQKSLSLWQRFNAYMGVEPKRAVVLDYPAGEFSTVAG